MKTSLHDDVNGQIVGRDYLQCRLTYEGRQQKTFYAETEEQALAIATRLKREKLSACGAAVMDIYPNDSWELQIAT